MKGLALDGGGIFGVGQAKILSQVDDLAKFDFAAGTSVGAVVAALVATGAPQTAFVDFFTAQAPSVFCGHSWRKYLPITPRYSDKQLLAVLKQMFPMRLRDVKIPLFITAADLNRRRLKVFCSTDPDAGDLPMWEVLRMATAAETYFLPWRGFADAGIYANNPAMVAVSGALNVLAADLDTLELCSIGTGAIVDNINIGSTRGWTLFRWGVYIIGSQLEGAANEMHAFFVSKLDLHKYIRIQFERQAGWTMDNPDLVDVVLQAWKQEIDNGIKAVNAF